MGLETRNPELSGHGFMGTEDSQMSLDGHPQVKMGDEELSKLFTSLFTSLFVRPGAFSYELQPVSNTLTLSTGCFVLGSAVSKVPCTTSNAYISPETWSSLWLLSYH